MRLFNRPLAALLSLALIAVGALIVIEVAADRLSSHATLIPWQRLYVWAEHTPWTQGSVRVGSIAIAVLGVLLLATELRRSTPQRLPIVSDLTDAAYTRRGVAATIRNAVKQVDGINHAAVTVKPRVIAVTATTAGRQPYTAQSLRRPVTEAAQQWLNILDLFSAPRISVHVITRSR
ncbi:alkaline shock response membrane anchor protein AmaP [Mycobacterium sp. ENV421]|uniref:DUF6286 domain-containing protein n=1 Tax=Mycobacterium sp. ENV421 TaxID=1213407 RepID=UPI000C9AB4B2|nr:DUF6286 domain-containing protein [Mycobacterium sp. ENV421]PND54551.1 alkaline shock response membrane anchor protein AmaP [Mycobacterium sp. ENV421]